MRRGLPVCFAVPLIRLGGLEMLREHRYIIVSEYETNLVGCSTGNELMRERCLVRCVDHLRSTLGPHSKQYYTVNYLIVRRSLVGVVTEPTHSVICECVKE